ncbi:hypothetical protein G5I_09630 [Acromyrmex echinatior]|uniref:Uncharacterized protein n=1 Tax=Acromyrmex echinatior TaxID=103372 RepID=F4WUQ3_ACREC|nr:hypothetical protein G5I_09630 [Acromyrmex echinatior]
MRVAMRDLLHALSRMQADRDTEAYRLGTSAVSTLLKLQGVKDSRAVRKLDERKAGRIRPLSTMKSGDDYTELDCDLKCIMKKTVPHCFLLTQLKICSFAFNIFTCGTNKSFLKSCITLMCMYIIGEMEKEDFAELSGFSERTEWQTQGAMTLTKGL